MFLIIGTRFFTWGSAPSDQTLRCGNCGMVTKFIMKKGMRFITLFFIVPIIPISGVSNMMECPHCKARYEANK